MWSESCSVMSSCLWPMDCIVHGILQARLLEYVAFPFSKGSSQPMNRTMVSFIAGGFFTNWVIREAHMIIHHLVLSCISLMVNGLGNLFMYLFAIFYFFFWMKYLFKSVANILFGSLRSVCWVEIIFYIFWIQVFQCICFCNIFSQNLICKYTHFTNGVF